jgi:ferredoxin
LNLSSQAKSLLSDLQRSRVSLNENGITFGRSRLAVRAEAQADKPGCAHCGLCLYGCPYGLIFNSASTLQTLQRHPDFQYVPNILVTKLKEGDGNVTIEGREITENSPREFKGARVFVGGGILATTRLILESLDAYDEPITILEPQYFLLPLLRYRRSHGVMNEQLHTLSQLFLEIKDPELSPHHIHLQVYSHNDMMTEAMRKKLGTIYPLARIPLHSSCSPGIRAVLTQTDQGSILSLEARQNDDVATRDVLRGLIRKLKRHRSHLKAVPISALMNVTEPGRSTHSGGAFAMRERPGRLETDRFGRPMGLERVHIIDASTFPEMPATTVTLTVMANAHRIGSVVHMN